MDKSSVTLFGIALVLAAALVVGFIVFKGPKEEPKPDSQPVPYYSMRTSNPEPKPEPKPEKPEWPEATKWEGTWNTERNRKLDGNLMCEAHLVGEGKWQGEFSGDWRRMRFSYQVEWEGPPEAVKGKATIGGVVYTWRGKMTEDKFTGEFESNRYIGSFDMKRGQ